MEAYVAEHPWRIDRDTVAGIVQSATENLIDGTTSYAQRVIDTNRASIEKEFDECITNLKLQHEKTIAHLKSLAYDQDKTDLRAELAAARTQLTNLSTAHEKHIDVKDARIEELANKVGVAETDIASKHILLDEAREKIAELEERVKELQQEQLSTQGRIAKLAQGSKEVTQSIKTLIDRQGDLSRYHEGEIERLKSENASLKKRAAKRIVSPTCEGELFDAISSGSVVLAKRRRSDMRS